MQRLPQSLRALDPARADALLAAALFLIGVLELLLEQSDSLLVDALTFAGLAAIVSQRRRAPIAVMVAVAATIAALEPVTGLTSGQTAFGVFVVAAYTVGAHVRDMRQVVAAGVAATMLLSTTIFTAEGGVIDVFFLGMFAVGG